MGEKEDYWDYKKQRKCKRSLKMVKKSFIEILKNR